MAGKITFLIAPARSGKSTYAKRWQKEIDNTDKVIINSDEIRLALHGQRYVSTAEQFVFAINEVMVRTLFNMGYHLLIDETNCTMGSIRKWLQIDPDAEAICVEATREECYERARASGQEDLIEKGVIDRHFANLVKLSQYGYDQECDNKLKNGCWIDKCTLFRDPYRNYILTAVEYIRKDVKEKKNA